MPPPLDQQTLEFLNLGFVACYVADGPGDRYRYVMFWLCAPRNFRTGG